MEKNYVQILVTGTTSLSKKVFLEEFDPLLIEQANLILSNLLGCECCVNVEDIELLAIESVEENEEE